MRISGQALNHHFRWYPLKEITDEIDIFLLFQAFVIAQAVKGLQGRSFDDIEQMKLNTIDSQIGYGSGGMENVRAAFTGKPEDHMGTDLDTLVQVAHVPLTKSLAPPDDFLKNLIMFII